MNTEAKQILLLFIFGLIISIFGIAVNVGFDVYENYQFRKNNEPVAWYERPVEGSGGLEEKIDHKVNQYIYKFIFPIAEEDFKKFTSPFGVRFSPFTGKKTQHNGVDISGIWKAEVLAVADGEVIEAWVRNEHPVYGKMVRIRHYDGNVSLYAHLDSDYLFVRYTEKVVQGQVIGRIGNTGLSTGRHLHFELHIDGEPVNPLLYLPNVLDGE